MTWVVGHASVFGYGIAMSDIRVTLADGTERDCLQKLYPVGRFLAVGFAGSVAIGLRIIQELQRLLYVPEDENGAWDPRAVAQWWPEDARKLFESYPEAERQLRSHLLLVGVHPTENNGDLGWAKTLMYKFRSPEFDAEAAEPFEVMAIGCGAWIPEFQTALHQMSTDSHHRFQIMQGESNNPGGSGTMLSVVITKMIERRQPQGISEHLHVCHVGRGRVLLRTNNHRKVGAAWTSWPSGFDGKDDADANFRMPRVATSIEELAEILGNADAAKEAVG